MAVSNAISNFNRGNYYLIIKLKYFYRRSRRHISEANINEANINAVNKSEATNKRIKNGFYQKQHRRISGKAD